MSGDKVTILDVEVDPSGTLSVQADTSFSLAGGDRGLAYATMYNRISDYITNNKVTKFLVKGSAIGSSATLAHLRSAELRGVIIAAASAKCKTKTASKATLSRTFGTRKVDEYTADDVFWDGVGLTHIKKGSREAGIILLAEAAKK